MAFMQEAPENDPRQDGTNAQQASRQIHRPQWAFIMVVMIIMGVIDVMAARSVMICISLCVAAKVLQ